MLTFDIGTSLFRYSTILDSYAPAHSCPKSVLKKEGEMRGKISTKKKKTKMEIEFWGASY